MSNLSLPRPVTGTVNSVNGKTGTVSLSTVDVPESTNQYYTNARARSALSIAVSTHDPLVAVSAQNTGIGYNATTGVLTLCAETINPAPHTLVLRDQYGLITSNCNVGSLTADILTILEQVNAPFTVNFTAGLNVTGNLLMSGTLKAPTVSGTSATFNSINAAALITGDSIEATTDIFSLGTMESTSTFTTFVPPVIYGINGLLYATDGVPSSAAVTDNLHEGFGATNLWFTQPRVIKTPVTGLTLDGSLSGKVTTSDSLSAAFSRIQTTLNQLSALVLALGKTV